MQEAQQRLVKLKRDVTAQRAQRARMNFYESKQEQAQGVRRQMDELVGKDLLRDFVKLKAADEDDVISMAKALNDQLLVEYNLDASQRSRHRDGQRCPLLAPVASPADAHVAGGVRAARRREHHRAANRERIDVGGGRVYGAGALGAE